MQKIEHTPGPWKAICSVASKRDPQGTAMVSTPVGIKAIDASDSGKTHAESMANARLIAAAPELLEALKAVREWLMDGFDENDAYSSTLRPDFRKALKKTNDAIKKAESE